MIDNKSQQRKTQNKWNIHTSLVILVADTLSQKLRLSNEVTTTLSWQVTYCPLDTLINLFV